MARVRDRELDLGRLCAAIAKARLQLRKPRQEIVDMVRQFAGAHYTENAHDREVMVNLIGMYVDIVGRNLIAKNPRVMLSTFEREHRPTVSLMQDWANDQIVKMDLATTLKRTVINALFSVGIVQIAIASPADAALTGWTIKAGEPLVSNIDLDDFVFDIHAKDLTEAGYWGHRVRVPLEVVRESDIYGNRRKDLSASEDRLFNLEGDERLSVIGRGYYSNQEEYEDFIDLWQIYLPRHRKVVTIADDDILGLEKASELKPRRALRVQDWIGPDQGPYAFLGYITIPGQALPKGPIQDIFPLHEAINNVCRKLVQQARDSKTITMYAAGNDDDAKRVNGTNDGEACRVDNPDAVKQVRMTDPNPALLQALQVFFDYVNKIAGNLELMGGMGPQSRTATQDKMLNANNSVGVADKQDTTTTFVSDVLTRLCWFWHHHPTKIMKTSYSIPGVPKLAITRKSYPNNPKVHGNQPGLNVRDMPFEDMNVKVDPYSLQHQTPQMRLQFLNGIVQQLTPLMGLLQQQGVTFDVNTWLKKIAQYGDSPDLDEIFTISQPPGQEPHAADNGPSAAGATERTYTRQSVGAESQQAKEALQSNGIAQRAAQGEQNGVLQPMGA